MREKHIHTSTSYPTDYLQNLRNAPVHRKRACPPHTTVAKLYQTELDFLSSIPENASLRIRINTVYANGTLDSFPANTILGNKTLPITHNVNYASHDKIGSTCVGFVVGTAPPFPHTCIIAEKKISHPWCFRPFSLQIICKTKVIFV